MFAISFIRRAMKCPKEAHLLAVKRVLWYLQGTADYGLFIKKCSKSDLIGVSPTVITLEIKKTGRALQDMFLYLVWELFHGHQISHQLLLCQLPRLNGFLKEPNTA